MHQEIIFESFIMINDNEIVNMLKGRGLIISSMKCRYCFQAIVLVPSKKKIDGFEWRCKHVKCSKYKTTLSIIDGSKFEGVKLPFKKILKILLNWSEGRIQSEIIQVVEISRTTLAALRSIIIESIQTYFQNNPIKLGGPGSIIHIDKTMVNHKMKAHRGKIPKEQIWIFCIVDTSFSPSRGFCCLVKNRSSETLLKIINDVVK